jgi:hypothetical protein
MNRARLMGPALLVWGVLLASIFASTASATWGNKCELDNHHHCYATSKWKMSGSGNGGGEEVMGESSEFYTVSMLVPYWEDHSFVSNEQWMGNPAGGWAEDGQLAGYDGYTEEGHDVNGDSLHPFYAFALGEDFDVWVDPQTVEGYEWRSYTEEDPGRNGIWCARFASTTVECAAGFDKYSNEVELGMEAGDEAQPENAGDARTGAQFTGGGWYHWGKEVNETRNYYGEAEGAYMCTRNYEAIPGYIEWGTPKSKWPC